MGEGVLLCALTIHGSRSPASRGKSRGGHSHAKLAELLFSTSRNSRHTTLRFRLITRASFYCAAEFGGCHERGD